MKILLAAALITGLAFAQGTLFEDDFNDGDAIGWIAIFSEGNHFVNDSLRYEISYDGMNAIDPCVVRGDSAGIYMTTNNYSVLLEGIGHDPSDYIGVYLRGTLGHTGYGLYLRFGFDDICIMRHDGPDNYTLIGSVGYTCSLDEFYWMRFECEDNTLKGKVWQGAAGDEPGDWMIISFDNSYANYGLMGFLTGRYSSTPGSSHAQVDNVTVTGFPPSQALEQITWAGIKYSF